MDYEPWQTPLNETLDMKGAIKKNKEKRFKSKPKKWNSKCVTKGHWENKEERKRTQVQAKRIEPKMCHKQVSKQSCFKSPTNHNKHIKKRKGCETWKGKKPKKKP